MAKARPSLKEIVDYVRKRDAAAIEPAPRADDPRAKDWVRPEGAERIYLMADDPEACRVAIAWMNTEVNWKMPKPSLTTDRGGRWTRRPKRAMLWAWLGVEVDFEALADAAGVVELVARTRFALLRDNLLIYPDGTISPVAKMVIGTRAKRKLEAH